MNRGVMQSSALQAAGNPNYWWNITNMLPPSHPLPLPTTNTNTNNFPSLIPQSPYPFSPLPFWPLDSDCNQQPPIPASDSWTNLFMGGLATEEHHQDLEHVLKQHNSSSCGFVFGNNNNNNNNNNNMGNSTSATPTTANSSQSCITTFSSTTTANSDPPPPAPPMPDLTPECNEDSVKKAKVQITATQSTFKVRKFGDRITALHQLVSPFGKLGLVLPLKRRHENVTFEAWTDTASVLLEAIGYIRFLHSQVEALSLPYLSSGSGNNKRQKLQQHPQSGSEPRKELRSKGLCLVPISWTSEVGRDNGADYWAPVLGGFR